MKAIKNFIATKSTSQEPCVKGRQNEALIFRQVYFQCVSTHGIVRIKDIIVL